MKTTSRSNALLVELLIVVLFFMLASTVLLQVFATARNQSARAELLAEAATQAQNVAEELYAAAEPDQALAGMGFAQQDGLWTREGKGFTTAVTLSREETAAGVMHRQQVQVTAGGETLLTLPVSRYEEVRP